MLKNYLKSLLLLLCMIVGAGTAWAETSTLTFTAKCNGSGTADDGVQWSVTSDGTESNFEEARGIHYGTSNAAVQYIKLTTSGISGTITKVVVNASAASGVSATASVTVGGDAFGGTAQGISATATDYTFEGSASGEIVVTVTKPSSAKKAIYVKSIVVTYSVSERPKFTVTFSDDGGSVTEESAGAGVTLPSRAAIGDYTFAGWSETNVTVETTVAPTIIPAGSYNPTANITLYPVYTRTEGGGISENTANVTISDYATTHNWGSSSSSGQKTITIDSNVTATCNDGGNSGKYYDDGWRIYQTETGKITVTTTEGTLTSVKFTFNVSNTGTLNYNDHALTSGTAVDVSGTSAEFTVGNSGSATNGQVRISAIEVKYSASSSTTYYFSSPVAAAVERPVINFAENPFLFSTTATITCATEGAVIYYSYDNKNWNEYTAALNITETTTIYAKATKGNDVSNIATATVTKNLAEPTVTISGELNVDLNGETDVPAGTLTAAVTYNEAAVDGATVTWSGNNDAVATVNATTGAVTIKSRGTVTFTANYAGNNDYKEATATKEITVIDSKAPGTQTNPYTVAQAIENTPASGTSDKVYISGIVSAFYATSIVADDNNYRYYISDNGTTTNQLLVYKGKGLNDVAFSDASDLQIGDKVVIYGGLTTYKNAAEVASGNYIFSLTRKADPGLSYETTAFETFPGDEDFVAPALTNPHELTVAYASSDEDVALVDANTGEILLGDVEGTATVTASFAGNETYKAGNASYTITLTKLENGLAFDQTAFETRVGKDFDAPTLNNPNGLTVTYTSSDEDVAMVDEKTGEVLVDDAGETTITATFAGSTKFKAGSASYTLTVIAGKMDADLAWNDATLSINAGLEKDVNTLYTVVSDGEVSFVSSDATVAEIVNGKLLAKNPGEATITVKVAEATDYAQASDDMVVTVTVFADMPAFDPTAAGGYVKVTATEDIVDGDYLIVNENEEGSVAFDGSLETLDEASNFIDVSISEGTIAETNEINASAFTIDVTNGTIQSASGKYIGISSNSNGLKQTEDAETYTNSFAIDEEGNAVISAVFEGSTMTLRYNSASNQNRFRYYKSGQEAIQLYRHQSAGVTIGSTGWRTLVASENVKFPAGVTAYIVTAEDGNKAKLKAVKAVKANVPVLLKGDAGTYTLTVAENEECANTEANLLKVSEQNTCENVYVLANKSNGVGFYQWTGGWMGAGRVYLPVPVSGARGFLAFDEDGETTGISTIQNAEQRTKEIYNLNGQRVNQPAKGLYIVNGKKVFIK